MVIVKVKRRKRRSPLESSTIFESVVIVTQLIFFCSAFACSHSSADTAPIYSVEMDKHKILAEAKAELERHAWGTFVEGKASVALGGTGVVVSGCEACRKRFGTNSQYLRHLADDVLPLILRQAFKTAAVTTQSTRRG